MFPQEFFNQKLRERGCLRVTVQKICRIARKEDEVREILETLWREPERGAEILAEVAARNRDLYEFERMLEKMEGR